MRKGEELKNIRTQKTVLCVLRGIVKNLSQTSDLLAIAFHL